MIFIFLFLFICHFQYFASSPSLIFSLDCFDGLIELRERDAELAQYRVELDTLRAEEHREDRELLELTRTLEKEQSSVDSQRHQIDVRMDSLFHRMREEYHVIDLFEQHFGIRILRLRGERFAKVSLSSALSAVLFLSPSVSC